MTNSKKILTAILLLSIILIIVGYINNSANIKGRRDQKPEITTFSVNPKIPSVGQTATVHIVSKDDKGIKGFELNIEGKKVQFNCNKKKTCSNQFTQIIPKVKTKTITLKLTVVDTRNQKVTEQKIISIVDTTESVCGNDICETRENYTNCSADCKTPSFDNISWLSVSGGKIVNEQGNDIKLRGINYDSFYILPHEVYFALEQTEPKLDEYNSELSTYFLSQDDIKEFNSLGANIARIDFKLWEIEKEPYVYSEESLKRLDDIIAQFGENQIYVLLDLHAAGQNTLIHNSEYGNILWDDEDFMNRVLALWGVLAKRYKDNPYVAGYDLINEPQAPTREYLHNFYEKAINKIREYDTKHIVFLQINLYKKESILIGGNYNDDNLAVSMHFYKPNKFTYQGRRGNPVGQKYPDTYDGVYWDKNEINRYFSKFMEFKEMKGKPLFIGEFSALDIGEDYALQWIADVMNVLNSKGLHYTFFNYKDTDNWGYYQATETTAQQINNLMNQLISGNITFIELTNEQKKFLLTKNYELFNGLEQVLKEGFKK